MSKSENPHRGTFANMRLCGAKARSNGHRPCRAPAMANGRCQMHGGKSTGARTKKGKKKAATANYKYGHYTKKAIAERKQISALLKEWSGDLYDF